MNGRSEMCATQNKSQIYCSFIVKPVVSARIKEVSELKVFINKMLNKENEAILTNPVVSSETPNTQ